MDLMLAMFLMAVLAVGVATVVAKSLGADRIHAYPHLASLLLVLCIVLSLGLLYGTKDQLFWAKYIPVSAAIIYANFTVLALAAGSGVSVRLPGRPPWRLYLNSGVLMVLSIGTLMQPVLQTILRPTYGADLWAPGNVCLQSQPATCSAAAGTTLLAAHHINVTEAQMVRWCLNDARGTPSLGLWRGLCIATEPYNLKPRVVTTTIDQLLSEGPWPVVIVVGLPPLGADPIYREKYGWSAGFRHSVVLFGVKADGGVDIGDPSIGRETWSQDDLRVLWRGEAIELVKQNDAPSLARKRQSPIAMGSHRALHHRAISNAKINS